MSKLILILYGINQTDRENVVNEVYVLNVQILFLLLQGSEAGLSHTGHDR